MAGCDDKSNIRMGNVIPLESTSRKANCSIVRSSTSVQSCDHDYNDVAKVVPSVIHNMNQYKNPGDSLYSGVPNGTGSTFVLLHDATFDTFLGYKHTAHFHQLLLYLDHSRNLVVDN